MINERAAGKPLQAIKGSEERGAQKIEHNKETQPGKTSNNNHHKKTQSTNITQQINTHKTQYKHKTKNNHNEQQQQKHIDNKQTQQST